MARVIVTIKIMPEDPSIDLVKLQKDCEKEITDFEGKIEMTNIEPIAFGLNAINIIFRMDENKGSPDPLEDTIMKNVKGVNSAKVTEVRRALG